MLVLQNPAGIFGKLTDKKKVSQIFNILDTFFTKRINKSPENYFLPYVRPGQSSVRKGDAGRFALLHRLHTGLFAQA